MMFLLFFFRNLLSYVFPTTLMALATSMLVVKGLKEQGRLGRSFGKVTIHDQPPSNTIEKIIAVKEAMHDLEKYMQTVNVFLLKIRTVLLAGQPQVLVIIGYYRTLGSIFLGKLHEIATYFAICAQYFLCKIAT